MEIRMLNSIIHHDEITLWWDKEWDRNDTPVYQIVCNGKRLFETTKTHCTIDGLLPDTEYSVAVSGIGEICVKTGKEKRKIDVTKAPYFACPDGKTFHTTALQKALDDCKSDECVYFPKGVYLTGSLNVHSDTEIYLEKGATLQGSENPCDYLPKIKSRFEGLEMQCYRALINVGDLDHTKNPTTKNVVIRGGGIISGGGKALCDATIELERERLKEFLLEQAEYVKTCENDRTIPGRARGRLVNISNSENVVLANVTLQYGPAWNVHFVYSKNIITYGCVITSQGVWNGDGWDPDSSENCTIFNTVFKTHDDGIAIKSGKNPEGNVINRPTKNIRIFDCRGRNGISLGSEMSGGIDGVYIWDCDFGTSYSGFGVKITKKRGGYVRNIKVKDCIFASIKTRCVPWNDDGESANTFPIVENFTFENIELTCISTNINSGTEKRNPISAIFLVGIDEPDYYLRNFTFKNVKIHKHIQNEPQIIEMQNCEKMVMENISCV